MWVSSALISPTTEGVKPSEHRKYRQAYWPSLKCWCFVWQQYCVFLTLEFDLLTSIKRRNYLLHWYLAMLSHMDLLFKPTRPGCGESGKTKVRHQQIQAHNKLSIHSETPSQSFFSVEPRTGLHCTAESPNIKLVYIKWRRRYERFSNDLHHVAKTI